MKTVHFSTLSRRLRLLRTHDIPVVKKSNKNVYLDIENEYFLLKKISNKKYKMVSNIIEEL